MNRNRSLAMLLIVLALSCAAMARPQQTPTMPWQFRLEVASFRLSISGGAPVRNRTALFDFGQLVRAFAGTNP